MKKSLLIGLLLCVSQPAFSQAHYVPGDFPLSSLTDFPRFEGFYFTENMLHYGGSVKLDRDLLQGRLPASLKLNADVFAALQGVTWQSGQKFLGADYGASIFVPLQNTSAGAQLDVGLLRGRQGGAGAFGVGDIFVVPLQLGWHGDRYDALFSYGFYAPTGSFDANSNVNVGRGYWTHQLELGGAYYLDKERTWSLNLVGTYEANTDRPATNFLGRSVNYNPGNYMSFDWGIRKKINPEWSVALTGYDTFQLSPVSVGFGVNQVKNYAHALGGEVAVTIPQADYLTIALKYSHEYSTYARFQGDVVSLTFAVPINFKPPTAPPPPKAAPTPDASPAPAPGKNTDSQTPPAPAPEKNADNPSPPAPSPEKNTDSQSPPADTKWFTGPGQGR